MASKKKRADRDPAPVPTGLSPRGDPCYRVADITYGVTESNTGTVKIKKLPQGAVLVISPDDCCTSSETYEGDDIYWRVEEDEIAGRSYHCRHIIKDEKGNPTRLRCNKPLNHSSTTNINSLKSHSKKHLRRTSKVVAVVSKGQATLSFGTGQSKKRKKPQEPEAAKPSHATAAVGTDVVMQDALATVVRLPSVMTSQTNLGSTSLLSDASAPQDAAQKSLSSSGLSMDLDVPSKDAAVSPEIEVVGCKALGYLDIPGIDYPLSFDFSSSYPFKRHGKANPALQGTNFANQILWDVTASGVFRSEKCKLIVSRDKHNLKEVEDTSLNGQPICNHCQNLRYNNIFLRLMDRVAKSDWGRLPNGLVPVATLEGRYEDLRAVRDDKRLVMFNHKRKIASLIKKVDDGIRFERAITSENVPALRRLLVTHRRHGGGLGSFVEKMKRASDLKRVGDNSFQRGYIQRGKFKDGKLDPGAYRALKLTLLMIKLGCHRLNHTHSIEDGGMGSRQALRHVSAGVVPSFKIRLSSCLDEQGINAIKRNMEDVFSESNLASYFETELPLLIARTLDRGEEILHCLASTRQSAGSRGVIGR